jgi:hypothetical protein
MIRIVAGAALAVFGLTGMASGEQEDADVGFVVMILGVLLAVWGLLSGNSSDEEALAV